MSDWSRERLRDELLGLARKSRQGAAASWPLASLGVECPTLLSVAPANLLVEDTDVERERAIIRLLQRVVESAEVHRSQSVQAAGDLLGLSKLTDEEIEAERKQYRLKHRRGPKRATRHGRYIRLLLAARYGGIVIKSAEDNEQRWMANLVNELCDYLDDKEDRLTALARDLGLPPTSAEPETNEASEPADSTTPDPAVSKTPSGPPPHESPVVFTLSPQQARVLRVLRRVPGLAIRVVKSENFWGIILLLFVFAALICAQVLTSKAPIVWFEPFRTVADMLLSYGSFLLILLTLAVVTSVIVGNFRERLALRIFGICTYSYLIYLLLVLLVYMSASNETDTYWSLNEDVRAHWQNRHTSEYQQASTCSAATSPSSVSQSSVTNEIVGSRFPNADVNAELDSKFCDKNNGGLTLSALGTNAFPGDRSRNVDDHIYADVYMQPKDGSPWTDCGIAVVPPYDSTAASVLNFGLEYVSDETGTGYRPIVSLTTRNGEPVVARSSILIPYDQDRSFDDGSVYPDDDSLKIGVLRKGNQYTFFVNNHDVLVYDWPSAPLEVHVSVQAHQRNPSQESDRSFCRFSGFNYWTVPSG